MAATYEERNAVYGDNYKNVGNVLAAMFPGGMALTEEDHFTRWHLFELIIVKLTRFANSKLEHQDSIHDVAVYAAMLEHIIQERSEPPPAGWPPGHPVFHNVPTEPAQPLKETYT